MRQIAHKMSTSVATAVAQGDGWEASNTLDLIDLGKMQKLMNTMLSWTPV